MPKFWRNILLFYPEERGNRSFRNIVIYQWNHAKSHCRRL